MSERVARCSCGAVEARCTGEPMRISACHCLDCQRRSGSAFAAQARFPDDGVAISGMTKTFSRSGEYGMAHFSFCPECGATIAFKIDALPGLMSIPIGAFAEPGFPQPEYSNYEQRKQPWVAIVGDGIDHID